jgi:valyl-tRNA synthetase
MHDLADRAIDCLRREGVRYVPDRYRVLSIEWLEQIRDWCISRQLWWGHRLPVWTCAGCGKVIVQVDPPTSCPDCGRDELTQDPDALDTWFSSALWPYATLGWPEETPELDYFYPTDLLITDRMILWLWVARMIFTGLFFLPDAPEGGSTTLTASGIPFHTVLVHPTILNREGRRMSRTLGTGVDPVELMEKYGTDATRFGLLLQCAAGQDVRFAEERIAMSRNFCNKIWNATRFLLLNLENPPTRDGAAGAFVGAHSCAPLHGRGRPTPAEIETAPAEVRAAGSLADRWILSRLAAAVETVTENLGEYRPDEAARRLYDFFWSELCDWYVEISKPALRDRAEAGRTRRFLSFVFETALRLLHPFLPFITEELWQRLPHRGDSIMIAPWPKAVADWRDAAAEEEMALLMEVVAGVRRLRADMGVSPGARVTVTVQTGSPEAERLLSADSPLVAGLTRAESMNLVSQGGPPAGALTHQFHWSGAEVVAWIEAVASVEELTRERDRLNKELARLSREVEGVESKLADPEFRTRAPAAVVEKVRSRQVEARAQQVGLRARLAEVESALREAGGAVG